MIDVRFGRKSIANLVACLVCLVFAVGAARAVPAGSPPVLPEVTPAVGQFHSDAAPGAMVASNSVAASLAEVESAPVAPVAVHGHHAIGYVSMETPIGQTPTLPDDNSPSILGRLELPRLVGPFGFFVGGNVQLKKGFPYSYDNLAYLGIEAPIGGGITAYTYAERRFNTNDTRFMAGCRYNFDVGF